MLKYTGGGFVIGVPARDLTEKELNELGMDADALVRTGLYKKAEDRAEQKKSASGRKAADADAAPLKADEN